MKLPDLSENEKRNLVDMAERITESQKRMLESISPLIPPPSVFEQFNQYARGFQMMYQGLEKSIKPILEAQERMAEMVKKFTATIDFEQLNKIAEKLADEGLKFDALEKTGWWYCPMMENIEPERVKTAAIQYKNGKRKAITNLFLSSSRKSEYKLLNDAVNRWEDNSLFKNRMRPIRDALNAHIGGLYTLSIPTLLPIAEGIASDYCKVKGIYSSSIKNHGNKKIKLAFDEIEKQGLYPFLFPDLFISIIENMIYKNTKDLNDPFHKKLNRHGILHGTYIKYYDESRSLKCFFLLDALSSLE